MVPLLNASSVLLDNKVHIQSQNLPKFDLFPKCNRKSIRFFSYRYHQYDGDAIPPYLPTYYTMSL